jgi:hypothetical protein
MINSALAREVSQTWVGRDPNTGQGRLVSGIGRF